MSELEFTADPDDLELAEAHSERLHAEMDALEARGEPIPDWLWAAAVLALRRTRDLSIRMAEDMVAWTRRMTEKNNWDGLAVARAEVSLEWVRKQYEKSDEEVTEFARQHGLDDWDDVIHLAKIIQDRSFDEKAHDDE